MVKTRDYWMEMKKKHPEIQFRQPTRKPDTIVMYKGRKIGKFSHTKQDHGLTHHYLKKAEQRMKEIDKEEETKCQKERKNGK